MLVLSRKVGERVVIGVGTGLGVAYLVPCGNRLQPLASEGGHAGFAPATPEQLALWHAVQATQGRVSAEEIVSGPGLARVHEFMRGRGDFPAVSAENMSPEGIAEAALESRDPLCSSALELFVECLGNVAGDYALMVLARGGVYIAGGMIPRIAAHIGSERFRAAFCAKGVHSGLMMRLPVRAVLSERLGVLGAARLATESDAQVD